MDVIGKEFSLNEADQDIMLKLDLQKSAKMLAMVMVGFLVLLFFIQAPAFLMGYILIMFVVVFGVVLLLRYFSRISALQKYRFELLDQGILMTYTKDQSNVVGNFLRDVSEARTGSSADQFIDWERLTKIKVTPTEMIFYDKGYDFMTANGKIELPKKLSFYPEIEEYIEAFYGHLIQKAG